MDSLTDSRMRISSTCYDLYKYVGTCPCLSAYSEFWILVSAYSHRVRLWITWSEKCSRHGFSGIFLKVLLDIMTGWSQKTLHVIRCLMDSCVSYSWWSGRKVFSQSSEFQNAIPGIFWGRIGGSLQNWSWNGSVRVLLE